MRDRNVTYERYTLSDFLLGDLADFNRLRHQLSPGSPELEASDLIFFSRSALSKRWVARWVDCANGMRGRIVGTISLIRFPLLSGQIGEIHDFVVDEAYRVSGIGSTLLRCALEEADRFGLRRVRLTSNPKRIDAHHLYHEFGFQRRDTLNWELVLRRPEDKPLQLAREAP